MQRFTQPIETALQAGAWMPALMSALALPDICGWLETPDEGVGARYTRWSQQWIEPIYTRGVGIRGRVHVFLSAADLYALRCAILHSGLDDITSQRAKASLASFAFYAPREGWRIHCNQAGDRLQLQVDEFCRDICRAVSQWTQSVTDVAIQQRMAELIEIRSMDDGIRF